MLKFLFIAFFINGLRCEAHKEVIDQAMKWQTIQRQLLIQQIRYNQLQSHKEADNKEFFNIQQQLGAIFLAQKRYRLGFGTAMLPSKTAMHNYVRKKTFLNLKSKELFPLYKKYVEQYQKKYANGEFERLNKNLKQLEALNSLHLKLFQQLNQQYSSKKQLDETKINDIESIGAHVKVLAAEKIYRQTNHQLNWISPVAGIQESSSEFIWKPIARGIILCPDRGTVKSIVRYKQAYVIFIKQDHFTYVVTGANTCSVNVGDKVKQGEPLGFCADKNPGSVELQLWRDDVMLNAGPYFKAMQL